MRSGHEYLQLSLILCIGFYQNQAIAIADTLAWVFMGLSFITSLYLIFSQNQEYLVGGVSLGVDFGSLLLLEAASR